MVVMPTVGVDGKERGGVYPCRPPKRDGVRLGYGGVIGGDCHGLQIFRSLSWLYSFPIVSSAALTVVSSVV